MIKKIISAAIGVVALSSAAHASSVTSPAGLTFTVGSACTVTGNVVNLGSYTAADTEATYAGRQGSINGSYNKGTDAAKALATLTCPAGTAWTMNINGAGGQGQVTVNNPSNVAAFLAYAYASDVSGTANANYLNYGNGISGTGTGAVQTVNGFYIASTNEAPYNGSTALANGSYNGTSTVTLTF